MSIADLTIQLDIIKKGGEMERIYTKHIKELKGKHEDVCIIDVLQKKSFLHEHIPGSINIPFEDGEQFIQAVEKIVPNKSRTIILYCSGEKCSASHSAAQALDEAGFNAVMHYKGGLEEWRQSGEPLAAGAERHR